MKVCLEKIQVAVMYVLQEDVKNQKSELECPHCHILFLSFADSFNIKGNVLI